MSKSAFYLLVLAAGVRLAPAANENEFRSPIPVAVLEYSWDPQWMLVFSSPPKVEAPDFGRLQDRRSMLAPISTLDVPEKAGPTPELQWFHFKLRLRNLNSVPISSVTWDYVFVDPASGTEIGRVRFNTPAKIRPGDKKELDGFTILPPTKVVSVSTLRHGGRDPASESIEILQVSFSDRTVWHGLADHAGQIHVLVGTAVSPFYAK